VFGEISLHRRNQGDRVQGFKGSREKVNVKCHLIIQLIPLKGVYFPYLL
jgi:hypothetical protein